MHRRVRSLSWVVGLLLVVGSGLSRAHPVAEHAVDVVIGPDKVVIDARISGEQVMVVEGNGAAPPPIPFWPDLPESHGEYVLKHLHVKADDRPLVGRVVPRPGGAATLPTTRPEMPSITFRLEFPVASPPGVVRVDQSFLKEYENWTAACVVRVRQSTDPVFQTALLTRERSVEFGCDWSGGAATRPAVESSAATTEVRTWPTIRAYAWDGFHHILTGYDHLLFVAALVLAATRLWDLVKVVTAFTLAHTLTLTLSVLGVVNLSERIVEPMIAGSIVLVALQNVFWPKQSTGWVRLGLAFAFGLFHGLGYAGGMKDAMSALPASAFVIALVAFTVGVEVAHQVVILPLFGAMQAARHWGAGEPREWVPRYAVRYGSVAVSIAGAYYLIQALG